MDERRFLSRCFSSKGGSDVAVSKKPEGEGEAFNEAAIRRARVPINNRCVAPTANVRSRLFLRAWGYFLDLVAAMWEVLGRSKGKRGICAKIRLT